MLAATVHGAGPAGNGNVNAVQSKMTPNCLTNIDSGTTASTRIGNKVEPKYITIKGVCTAGSTTNPKDNETTDNVEAGTTNSVIARYCRTTMRIIIIRDKSMNEKGYVTYSDVYAPPSQTSAGQATMAAANPFLWNRKLDTIGRYEILREAEFTMDQTDPQKAFNWTIPLKGIPIKFNGAGTASHWKGATNYTAPVTGDMVGTTGLHNMAAVS